MWEALNQLHSHTSSRRNEFDQLRKQVLDAMDRGEITEEQADLKIYNITTAERTGWKPLEVKALFEQLPNED